MTKKAKVKMLFAMLPIFGLTLAWWSSVRARHACDCLLGDIDHPPFYSIRFALFPQKWILPGSPKGLLPSWIVTYAKPKSRPAQGFVVSLSGKVLNTGVPLTMPNIVSLKTSFDNFIRTMDQLDRALQPGMTYSNVVDLLGAPIAIGTNGSVLIAHFMFSPPTLPHDCLTNGYSIEFTNGVIIRKSPTLMGSM